MAEENVEEPQFFYCESCGVQLKKPEDRGGNILDNTWCKDCCHADGTHKTKEEVIPHIISIIKGPEAHPVMGEKIEDDKEATELALDYMSRMPAWEEKKEEED